MKEKTVRDESNLHVNLDDKKRALLISVYQGAKNKHICEEHLDELELLVNTYGMEVVAKESCNVRKYDAALFITKGKLESYINQSTELDVDVIIFDDEISPAQQRNLQEKFQKPVIDRTEVIIGVFAQRAQTKEARLQIELAKTKYELPRLKRLWTHLSRQQGTGGTGGGTGGSGGYTKGEGEKQIEIDKRIIKRKIEQLNDEIKEVSAIRETQRVARGRSQIPIFAIIGYTNAGKSTLLNSLTQSNVFVEDKLFATLDTTTRKFTLPNNQEILLIDTVGFIRKLPHLLVAAFRSTLEEAVQADILLHLIDASHPMAEEQAETSHEVLKELGAKNKNIITVFNKIDLCEDIALLNRLRMTYPKNVQISALKKTGFEDLIDTIVQELSKQRRIISLRIPQKEYSIIGELMRQGTVISQEYDENDVIVQANIPTAVANKFERYIL